ncbi:MAG: DUF1697 domain-containing protein [Ignavibacteriae bacterium]|nr:DUF1697 domain-containing protein [Ignavibacteriota bacterium]
MPTYISLLRGVNVSGQKPLKSTDLAKTYLALGFSNARTYIQSGNVVFKSERGNVEDIRNLIESGIRRDFAIDVPVILRSLTEFRKIVKRNPFLRQKNVDQSKLHVTFLSSHPKKQALHNLTVKTKREEAYKLIGREIYLYCPYGYAKTKLTNNVFEAKLNVLTTTRNWRTVCKLLALAESVESEG